MKNRNIEKLLTEVRETLEYLTSGGPPMEECELDVSREVLARFTAEMPGAIGELVAEYTTHGATCDFLMRQRGKVCSCGLADLLAKLEVK